MVSYSLYFKNEHPEIKIPPEHIRMLKSIITALLDDEDVGACEISVVVTKDTRIRALNKKYCNRNTFTDVLSFGLYKNELDHKKYGDIYISLDQTKKQSRQYKVSLTDELSRLIIHGVFHLIGYDHKTKKELSVMDSKTVKWLNAFSTAY